MNRPGATPAGGAVSADNGAALVEIQGLVKHFPAAGGGGPGAGAGAAGGRHAVVHAVDGVDLVIGRGETVGLVGESGCGKSTLGRCLVRLYRPTAGRILFDGDDIAGLSDREMGARRRRLQMIFQDPFASLNPRMTVEELVGEPLSVHRLASGQKRRARVQDLVAMVGLDPRMIRRYPHEFSGGQRQRIGIARALALEPEFVVADEPISALDVSIQAQILNLLAELTERLRLTILFVSHDLSAVRHLSGRVAAMYLGRIVEVAPTEALFTEPLHPYTAALLSAVPPPDPAAAARRRPILLAGDVPSPLAPPPGCRFHTRCPMAADRCRVEEPALRPVGADRVSACHFAEEVPARMAAVDGAPASAPATTA